MNWTETDRAEAERYLSYWSAAALSEFAKPSDWKDWADRRICVRKVSADWLYELSNAEDGEAIERILNRVVSSDSAVRQGVHDTILGYMMLRLQRRDYLTEGFLQLAGEEAELGNASEDPEFFYLLLNDLESGRRSRDEIEAELQSRLKLSVAAACGQWTSLMHEDQAMDAADG